MRLKSAIGKCLLVSVWLHLFAAPSIFAQNGQAPASQGQSKVSGKITDDKGVALAGVSIQPKGGKLLGATDNEGKFSVMVASGTVLLFTSTGFAPYEHNVNGDEAISVQMSVDQKSLDDVVVVGYGTQKKRSVAGAVASVGYEKFKDRSYANVAQSLAGTIAGVNIVSSQGAPGFGPTIKIRGTSSLTAGTTPLYVVDGMALENFDLNSINPQDIQSVDILKDAASSAIYGARGGNGVILITTKLGKSGKPQVSFMYEYGLSKVTRKVDMMNAQEWIDYYIDARNNAWVLLDPVNNKPTDDNTRRVVAGKNYMIPPDFISNPEQFGEGTDWQDVMFRTAQTQNAQLSVSGGTDKTSYLFSMGYLNQEAVLIQNYYKRLTLRSNIRQKITDHITAGLNLAFTGLEDRTDGTTGKSDVVSLGLQSDPIFPEYNENGYLGFLDPNSEWKRFQNYGVQLWSPHSMIDYADKKNKTYNTLGNAYLEITPIKNLLVKGSINGNLTNNNYNWYWVSGQGYGYSSVLPAQANSKTYENLNWQAEITGTYNMKFGKDEQHNLTAIAGYSSQKNTFSNTNFNGTNFPNDLVRTLNAAGSVTKGPGNIQEEWSLLSILGKVSYGYKNKYFLNATFRSDGSSRFGPNNKWGNFPSVSGAWVVRDEGFMQNSKAISNLKLRVSFGQTGNNQIPNYGSVSLLGTSQYASGTTLLNGLRINTISNSELRWEKTGQGNIGIDLGLFNNRVNVIIDAYKSVTKDMLLNVPVPVYSGFTTQLTNIGSMENKGLEITINTRNIEKNSFSWSTDFNFSLNRNKVLKLGPNNAPIEIDEWGYFVTEVGQPLSNYKGYIFDGLYNNVSEVNNSVHYAGAAPGDPIIRDVNGDKKIDVNDRTILGNAQPDFVLGLNNTFQFKGFEFSFLLQGVFGNEIWNQQTRFSKFWNDSRNSYGSVTNYWKSEQDPGDGKTFKPYATYPATAQGKAAYIQGYSDYWMEDGSFVRVKNIRLSYALPGKIMKNSPVKSVRIYVNAENVYVFSNYVGYDPESSTYSVGTSSVPGANGGNASISPNLLLGADYGAYPLPLMLTFGVKLDF